MMRKLFGATVFFLAAAAVLSGQSKNETVDNLLPPLQIWLSKAMEKNGSHSTGSLNIRLTNVRFEGCRISFVSETKHTFDNSVPPAYGTGDLRTQGTRTYRPDSKSSMAYSFDLTKIDPSDISERFAKGKMETLLLNTIDRDPVIYYRSEIPGFPTKTGSHKTVSIRLRKRVIPEFKEKLIAFIRMCQLKPRNENP